MNTYLLVSNIKLFVFCVIKTNYVYFDTLVKKNNPKTFSDKYQALVELLSFFAQPKSFIL
jgi:hypothetical protein